jgi:hypothetical protein
LLDPPALQSFPFLTQPLSAFLADSFWQKASADHNTTAVLALSLMGDFPGTIMRTASLIATARLAAHIAPLLIEQRRPQQGAAFSLLSHGVFNVRIHSL